MCGSGEFTSKCLNKDWERTNVCQETLYHGDWTYMTKTNQRLCHKASFFFGIQVTAGQHGLGMDYLDMVSKENTVGSFCEK